MSRTVSTLLLDLAAWIAPPHRRQWIAGLRAEAAQAGHSTGWAWGALTTALGQRLADTVASGLALRLILGGFVIGVAATLAVFITSRLSGIEASAARAGNEKLIVLALLFTALILLLLSGGLAILFSAGRPWFNRYGRTLFALFSCLIGWPLVGVLAHEAKLPHAVTAYGREQDMLSTVAGALFIAASPMLLFRRGRLFLTLAAGALGIEIAQWGLELPYLSLSQEPMPLIAFCNACMPGLLMVAAIGLLLERRKATAG